MRDPFKIDSPTCISFSGGRTSAYMLWRVLQSNGGLPAEAVVCFANTGKEEEATLRFVRDCGERWDVPILWVEYRSEAPGFAVVSYETASRNGEPFEAVIVQRGGVLPNRVARYCSSEMKTRTMHRHLRSIGWSEWDTFIGIRADEPVRVGKFRANPFPESKSEEVHMPLAAVGIGSRDVAAFWRSQPFDLGLPSINGKTMHGNCSRCFLKPLAQIVSLERERHDPWWAEQERKAERITSGTGCRFRDDRPSYSAIARFARDQSDMFDAEEEAIACFCGD